MGISERIATRTYFQCDPIAVQTRPDAKSGIGIAVLRGFGNPGSLRSLHHAAAAHRHRLADADERFVAFQHLYGLHAAIGGGGLRMEHPGPRDVVAFAHFRCGPLFAAAARHGHPRAVCADATGNLRCGGNAAAHCFLAHRSHQPPGHGIDCIEHLVQLHQVLRRRAHDHAVLQCADGAAGCQQRLEHRHDLVCTAVFQVDHFEDGVLRRNRSEPPEKNHIGQRMSDSMPCAAKISPHGQFNLHSRGSSRLAGFWR